MVPSNFEQEGEPFDLNGGWRVDEEELLSLIAGVPDFYLFFG